jgi:DNA invertase Pin-like site-specific DNA recombinase
LNAVIYARYSSHNQREESIEGQLRECNEFALRNGITIVGEYIDRAISGKTDDRASFQKMIRDSEKGHWEAVIMYTLDRLGRNRYDLAIYKAKLKKNGVRVFYAKQTIPDGPEGIIFESLMEGMAEYYSENLSRNVQRGMMENALAGKTTGGKPPLGYRINEALHYEIEPVGAKVVREIFQMYADGHTAAAVVEHCVKMGYKTALGRPFTRNSITPIIRNEKYIGVYRCNDIVIPDAVPPIIDKALFEKVQSMIKHNYATRVRGKAKMDYLLTTKLFCGHCGSPMLGESGTGRNGTTYHYYKCFNRKKGGKCDKKQEQKDWIENFVVRYTVEQVLTDENIEIIATKAMEIINREAEDKSALEGLKAALKDCEKRLANILDLMEQGIATESTKGRLLDLEAKKEDLIAQIAREETKKPFLTKERIVFWLETFKNGNTESIDFKRKIIDALVNSVHVYDINGGNGRRFVFTWNLSQNNTSTVNVSDIDAYAPPKNAYSNRFFFIGEFVFGCVYEIEDIG